MQQQGSVVMIMERDKKIISDISEKYKVKRVLLFGSSVSSSKRARDIDIAVEGIAPGDFFRYYGELMFALSKPVDVIDLSEKTQFTELVRKEGMPVYG
jgi:uncharacterized protein